MHFEIFSSNRVEVLFHQWKNLCYQKGMHPFHRRFLIVPSPAMKSWLQRQLANDPLCKVAAGVEIDHNIEHTLQKIQQALFDVPVASSFTPSAMELSWMMETLLRSIVTHSWEDAEKALWQPLLGYLQSDKNASKKSEGRLLTFASHLAHLFLEYGQYAYNMLDAWEAQDSHEWQGALWHLLKKRFPTLKFPYQQLHAPKAAKTLPPHSVSVHLFAMSFIPQGLHHFLTTISTSISVYYYLLSPCQMFWSDLYSDKERQQANLFWQKKGAAESQINALDSYLSDRNSLLANLGALGQQMAKLIEESPASVYDHYVVPAKLMAQPRYAEFLSPDLLLQNTTHAPTLLEAVQADMVLLCNARDEKIDFTNDTSIQIHRAITKQREMEIIYNQLISILNAHSQDQEPIFPGDILVMAPDLVPYESAIKAVFDGPDSLLKYQLLEMPYMSTLARTFMQLLNLAGSRWDQKAITALLKQPDVQRKHKFSYNDILQIEQWIAQSGVKWGQNADHRQEALQQAYHYTSTKSASYGTWDYALGRLLMGLAVDSTEMQSLQFNFDLPQEGVENAQVDLFAKWIALFAQLKNDLTPLFNAKLTLREWSKVLLALKENYLEIDPANKEAVQAELILNKHLMAMGKAGNLFNAELFGFDSIKRQLEKHLKEEKYPYQESNLQAIRFCSLQSMRATPAKVVVLIGLSEETFPRPSTTNSLNLIAHYAGNDYYPTQANLDRYLFLEALLAARRYFILSYVGYNSHTHKESPPSLLIRELQNYIDEAYTIDQQIPSMQCTFNHPFDVFHKSYFEPDAKCQTFFKLHYKMAAAYYKESKKNAHALTTNYYQPLIRPASVSSISTIATADLIGFASNPIKAYFNQKLNLYIHRKAQDQLEEKFVLSALDKYQLRLQAVKSPLSEVLHKASLQGRMPEGMFHKVATAKLQNEVRAMHEILKLHDIQPSAITSLTFSEQNTSQHYCEKKGWMLPPLTLEGLTGQKIKIVGTLQDITPQGLLFHHERDLKQMIRLWPHMLLLSTAIQQHALPIKPQLISTKNPKPIDFSDVAAPTNLNSYLAYYFKGINSLSLLVPEWTALLLKGEEALNSIIKAHMSDEFNPCYNEYALWLFRERSHLLCDVDRIPWHDIAYEQYGHLLKSL